MNATKTIDVKGLGHAEKEALIFPSVQALRDGETVRIVVEFNPVPLVYMLKAQDSLDISYEKEGPDEWILLVTKGNPQEEQKEQFKELLTQLREGEVSLEAKKKAKTLLEEVDAKTLGVLEQELIREGVSHDEIRKSLCDIHLEVLKDSLVAKRMEVSAPHPVHTFMQEHKVILSNLIELGSLVDRLKGIDNFDGMGEDLEKLQDIAHHLVEAESHHQREEEVLFPELEKRDIVEPPQIMKMDHVEFRKRKQELYQLSHRPQEHDFSQFKAKVIELGEYLGRELESHIFKEDNILYQIALQVLNPEEWEKIKRLCDELGYCCFTSVDQEVTKEMVDLDLREIMPFERHDLIFQKWDALPPGATLRIINDHDPKPLHYQFEAEHKSQYEWEYEQEGPKDWIVKIKKTGKEI